MADNESVNAPISSSSNDYFDDSSLESSSGAPNSFTQVEPTVAPNSSKARLVGMPSLFRFHRVSFVITILAIVFICLIGVSSFLIFGLSSQKTVSLGSQAVSYPAQNIAVTGDSTSYNLLLSGANSLQINGKVQVKSSLTLTPSGTPDAPTAGQIYYNQNTNTPYYYNGSQFISLAPTITPEHVTALGGIDGNIGVGEGLQVTGGQLALSSAALSAITSQGSITGLSSNSGNLSISSNGGQLTISDSILDLLGPSDTNTVPLFNGSSQLGPSLISEPTPTSIKAGGDLSVTGNAAVAGSLATNGPLTVSTLGSAGSNPIYLCYNSSDQLSSCGTNGGGTILGGGISNYIARWTGVGTLGTGLIYDSGSDVGINTSTPNNELSVNNLSTPVNSATVAIETGSAADQGLVIQGETGQTADLLDLENNNGTVIDGFDSNGDLVVLPSVDSTNAFRVNYASGQPILTIDTTDNQIVAQSSSAGTLLSIREIGDNHSRIALQASGTIAFGDGADLSDVQLSRTGVGSLTVTSLTNSTTAFQVQSASNVDVLNVDTLHGQVSVGTGFLEAILAVLNVKPSNASAVGEIIQSQASQTADLLQLQNSSSSTVLSGFNANGGLYTNGENIQLNALATPIITATSPGTAYYFEVTALNAAHVETVASNEVGSTSTGSITWSPVNGATTYYVYRGTASGGENTYTGVSPTGCTTSCSISVSATYSNSGAPATTTTGTSFSLQGWSGQHTNTLFSVTPYNSVGGGLTVNGYGNTLAAAGLQVTGNYYNIAGIDLISSTAAVPGEIIQGASGQTADLLQAQNSSGTVLDRITSGGELDINVAAGAEMLGVETSNASAIGELIIGQAAQTGDLLQFRSTNSSGASIVLSGFNASGGLYGYGTNNTISALNAPSFTTTSAGTAYYYEITAYNNASQTVASNSLGMANDTTALSWSAVPGATGYYIYRNTTNSFTSGSLLLTTITNGQTTSYTDTGSATTAGLPPTTNNGSSLTLQGWNGQAGNSVLNVTTYGGGSGFKVNGYGNTLAQGGESITGGSSYGCNSTYEILCVQNTITASTPAATIQGISGQTANLLQFMNSSNAVMSEFTANGALQGGNATGSNTAGTNLVLGGGEGTGTGGGGNINFNIYQAGTAGSSNNTTASTVLSLNGSNGSATFENSTNSTNAFQVQNASGVDALNINTSALTTTLQASSDVVVTGSNLITNTNFTQSAWTSTGWTTTATTATNNSSNTNPLSTNQVVPTIGSNYLVSYTVTGNAGNLGGTLHTVFGGQNVENDAYTFNTPSVNISTVVTATTTGILSFTPSPGFNGIISNVSVKLVTSQPVPVLVINNASGTANIQLTASSSTTNDFIGLSSGQDNISGVNDVSLGTNALQGNTTGQSNVALGYDSLQSNTVGSYNVAIGDSALLDNTISSNNIAIGKNALELDTTGFSNVAIGTYALSNNNYGVQDTAIGYQALQSASGMANTDNTAFGDIALRALTTGGNNAALGAGALSNLLNANDDTALGSEAGSGTNANQQYSNPLTSGQYDTFVGYSANPGQSSYQISGSSAIGANSAVNQSNAIILGCTNNVDQCSATSTVGIGSQYAPNALTVSPSTYGTNGTAGASTTISQTGTTITGSGTAFTYSMTGGTIYYNDGTTATVAYVSSTSLLSSVSKSMTAGSTYTIVYGGFNVTSTGTVLLQPTTDSTQAFNVYNSNGNTVLAVDSTDQTVGIGGNPGTAAKLSVSTGSFTGEVINESGSNPILNLQNTGTNVVTVGSTGKTLFQNSTNSVTAFQIQNSTDTSNLLVADTVNSEIGINQAPMSAGAALQVTGGIETNGQISADQSSGTYCGGAGYKLCLNTAGRGELINESVGNSNDLLNLSYNNSVVARFTYSGALILGTLTGSGTGQAGSLTLADGSTDNFGLTLNTSSLSGNRIYTFPNSTSSTDQVCLLNLGNCSVGGGGGGGGGGSISGSGSANYVAVWTGSSALGTGNLYDNGAGLGINNTNPGNLLSVNALSTASSTAQVAIDTGSAANTALLLQASSGQTANLLSVQTSSGLTVAQISATGNLGVSNVGASFGSLSILTHTQVSLFTGQANNVGLAIQGFTSQTADLLDLQNSSGTILDRFTASGHLGVNALAPSEELGVVADSSATIGVIVQGYAGQTASLVSLQDAYGDLLSGFDANGSLYDNGQNANISALAVPSFTTSSTGTSYYYEITAYNNIGETIGSASLGMANDTSALSWNKVNGAGGYKIYRNTTNSFTSGSLLLTNIAGGQTTSYTDTGSATTAGLPPTTTTGTGLTIQQWAGQSGNALTLQGTGASGSDLQALNSNGGSILSVSAVGNGTVGIGGAGAYGGRLNLTTSGAGTIGVVIRATAAQTADLYENENSAGTLLSEFTANGALQGGNATGSNTAGTNLVLGGGEGTGTGGGGNINFNIYQAGTAGSSNNTTASTVLSLNGSNGSATFENSTNSTNAFQVQNASGSSIVSIGNVGVNAPSAPTLTSSSGGGSFAAGTYYYQIAAVDANGTTLAVPSSPSSVTLTGSTSSATLSWAAVAGATGYVIYRSPNAGVSWYGSEVSSALTSVTDTGAYPNFVGTLTLPTADSSGGVLNLNGTYDLDGSAVLQENTARWNLFVGQSSGNGSVVGQANTGLGINTLRNLGSTNNDTAIGTNALQSATTGGSNTSVGVNSLEDDVTGSYNTALGLSALLYLGGGNYNVAVGDQAGYGNTSTNADTSGSYNTYLGNFATDATTLQLQYATAIGTDSTVGASNNLILGCVNGVNSCAKTTNVGIGTSYAPNQLTVAPNTYTTGTISQSSGSGVITGSGTTFTSGMVGGTIYYADGNTGTITAYTSATQITSSNAAENISGVSYTIVYGGFNVSSTGTVLLQPTADSTTALVVNNAGNTRTLLGVDTVNNNVSIDGTCFTSGFGVNIGSNCSASGAKLTVSTGGIGESISVTGTSSILQLQNNGSTVVNVASGGNTSITTSSTTALQVGASSGTTAQQNTLVVDTADGIVGIGAAPTTGSGSNPALEVTGSARISSTNYVNQNVVVGTTNLTAGSLTGQIEKPYNTSGAITSGDPVILSGSTVQETTTAQDNRLVGVVDYYNSGSHYANVAYSGVATVNVMGTVNVGDQLVTSTTAGYAVVNNSATTGIIGYAATSQASGTGQVSVRLQVNDGQVNPNIQGNLTVNGTTALTGTVTTSGNVNVGGDLSLGGGMGNLLNIGALTTADSSAQLAVSTNGTANKGIVIQAVAGQSADLLQAQSSTGTILASISAAGNLTVKSATINGTLSVNGHIITGNSAGGTTTAVAGINAGTGATVTFNGNDSAGTISITVGSGSVAGDMAEITFASPYASAPHVVVSPDDANSASLQPFRIVSTTKLVMEVRIAPTPGQTYTFDYLAQQ